MAGIIHWAVCQVHGRRAKQIRAEAGRSTFQPTYARSWFTDGKPSSRERELYPGYLFFEAGGRDWAAGEGVGGVVRVLSCPVPGSDARVASKVPPVEFARIMLESET